MQDGEEDGPAIISSATCSGWACPCTLQECRDSQLWMLRRWRRGSALARWDPASLAGNGCGGESEFGRGNREREEAISRDVVPPWIRDCASTGPGLAKKGLCKPGMLSVNVNGNCIIFVACSSGRRERIWQSVDDRLQSRARYDITRTQQRRTWENTASSTQCWFSSLGRRVASTTTYLPKYMLGGKSLPRLPTHDGPLPNST